MWYSHDVPMIVGFEVKYAYVEIFQVMWVPQNHSESDSCKTKTYGDLGIPQFKIPPCRWTWGFHQEPGETGLLGDEFMVNSDRNNKI